MHGARTAVVTVAVATLLPACGLWEREAQSPSAPTVTTTAPGDAPVSFASIPEIVRQIEPSVVAVRSGGGEGSGVIYDPDGVIVTNDHVVTGLNDVEVIFASGDRSPAEVVATDPLTDLAVLRVERDDLPAAPFAEKLPPVGSLAVAVGNPLGFENTATAGIVSGLGRSIPGPLSETRALVDLIQTDAAISPGNSGGALVGPDGDVIGVNVAYIPPAAGAVSLGFAIPAPTVADVVSELLATGRVRHPYLGVVPTSLSPEIAETFGLDTGGGVVVLRAFPGSPASQAGVQAGDIITAVDGQRVVDLGGFLGELRDDDPGDAVVLRLRRDSETQDVKVILGERAPGE